MAATVTRMRANGDESAGAEPVPGTDVVVLASSSASEVRLALVDWVRLADSVSDSEAVAVAEVLGVPEVAVGLVEPVEPDWLGGASALPTKGNEAE